MGIQACVCGQPDEAGDHGRCSWRREALKITLVDHAGVDVEAGQAQGSASAVHEGCDPAPAPQRVECPDVGHQSGRSAERHHVGERIHLLAKSALGIGHAGDPPVQTVQHHGRKNGDRGHFKTAVHGHHDGEEAAEQGCQRDHVGHHVDAFRPFAGLGGCSGQGVVVLHQAFS